MHTIKIFLASSAELKDDRDAFRIFISEENDTYNPKGIKLEIKLWEDFIDAMSATRLQDEYNKTIIESEIFIMLFFTKVGKYTEEEFEKAFQQFLDTKKPRVYTYFKNDKRDFDSLDENDTQSLWAFKKKLKALGHFETKYDNDAEFHLHFKQQLDKLFKERFFKFPIIENPQTHKCLSAGQPSVPPGFIGRETELANIKQKLEQNRLLLVHAEGGMGKTTLAAKYLTDNIRSYSHFAWLFCDAGINEQIKTLALPLKVDLTLYAEEDDQLLALKTAMQNLGNDCLLVLDNANHLKHIENFQRKFGGLSWHILLTSRCQNVLPTENELTLQHLKFGEARILFKKNQDENTPAFDALLDRFLKAIGYNTLMIELFSKNLHELSALGETLEYALQQFEDKGIFLGERSFEIRTAWTDHVHKEAATTDQIIEILYDLTKLEKQERQLLVNLALLPAENHLVTLLVEVLTPEDNIDFAKQLKALAQKGWLASDTATYRMNPVVQQIILAKNRETMAVDSEILVSNLSEKLKNDGYSLVNLKSYAQAQPFVELAESVTRFLKDERFDIAVLLLNLSDYYKDIGNRKKWLEQLDKAAEIFKKVNKENYGVCISRLGMFYESQGNLKKALEFFEQYNIAEKELFNANPQSETIKNGLAFSYGRLGTINEALGNIEIALNYLKQTNILLIELFEINPQSETIKNGLAISYQRLGIIYEAQGNLEKALAFFEQDNGLKKELFEANPQSETIKNGLAISYQRLGIIHEAQGYLEKALAFFEQSNSLSKELFGANPQSENIKYGLAVSYQRLGNLYEKQGNLEKALGFFEQDYGLKKELFDANPQSETIKNGLAISYHTLGNVYEKQGNLKNALAFFEQDINLTKELFAANAQSVDIYNGLAVSYERLGHIYKKMQQREKAKDCLQKAEAMYLELTEKVPEAVEYKKNLKEVRKALEDL